MNKGELVSDQLVLEIVKKNLSKDYKGWILKDDNLWGKIN